MHRAIWLIGWSSPIFISNLCQLRIHRVGSEFSTTLLPRSHCPVACGEHPPARAPPGSVMAIRRSLGQRRWLSTKISINRLVYGIGQPIVSWVHDLWKLAGVSLLVRER